MSELLLFKPSFDWTDASNDRNVELEELNKAIQASNRTNDIRYFQEDFFSGHLPSGMLWNDICMGFDSFKKKYPWIFEPEFRLLTSWFNYFRFAPNNSQTLADLTQATGDVHNAWIGLQIDCSDFLVHNESSWKLFHHQNAASFNRAQRIAHKTYFLTYFQVGLCVDLNTINQQIKRGQLNPLFDRIDSPHTNANGEIDHGEQIHMHFTDRKESALNINGVWKHKEVYLPNDVCDKLIEWGFILPENRR